MALRLSEGLGRRFLKRSNRNRPCLGHRLAKRLDSLYFVHRLSREVGLPTAWARPHRDALDDEEVFALAIASCHVLQLHSITAAVHAARAR